METPADLITLIEAARLLPSHRPGRRVHYSAILRWIRAGRLPGYRRGRWWFVSRADVLGLAKPTPVVQEVRRAAAGVPEWARAYLRSQGL